MRLPGRIAPVLVLLSAFLAACSGGQEEQGVVARVNGSPIYLRELESKYDLMLLNQSSMETPSVEKLKEDHGLLLSDLIVRELVRQELAESGLEVTREELEAAEKQVRSDYPEGAFEEVLVEEYIDLESWRKQLRSRLVMEKFFAEVLRPRITLDYHEAEAYYKEHIADFFLPSRKVLLVINGQSKDVVRNAAKHFAKDPDAGKLAETYKEITVEKVRIREDRLVVDWKNALKGLEPGEAGPVMAGENGYTSLVYLGTSEARVLEPSSAYPIVEKVLLERKLRKEFDAWLEESLSEADIQANPHIELENIAPSDGAAANP
jgi:hypothetical protein